jgi:hypothetical protein
VIASPSTIVRSIVAAAAVLAVAAFYPNGFGKFLHSSGPGIASLRSELEGVPLPARITPVAPAIEVARGGPVGVTQSFSTADTPRTIANYFKQTLPKHGWTYMGERVSATEITVRFCRAEKSFSATPSSVAAPGNLYVSMLWTDVKRNPHYCPRLKA